MPPRAGNARQLQSLLSVLQFGWNFMTMHQLLIAIKLRIEINCCDFLAIEAKFDHLPFSKKIAHKWSSRILLWPKQQNFAQADDQKIN